ncbi:MAG: hypothetical protein CMN76_06240 [Spirochaetaceae bacterium]|nr:hypothetical protein [Spirochaetaceae bacterium]|tara:strand:- start:16105 stop:16731 length:627 start_codon:yes stop_codon:yes gene_type:complete
MGAPLTEKRKRSIATGRIFLIRHGKPEFPYSNEPRRWIWGSEFNRLSSQYDQSSLNPHWNRQRLEKHNPDIIASIQDSHPLSSDLIRARETATLILGPSSEVKSMPLFREVPLPTVPHFLRLPAYWHLYLARLLWYAGKSSAEPKAEARKRARRAADVLEDHESRHPVSLFSHGFFLYMLTHELMRRGWQCEHTRPMRYLEIRTFRKP